MSQKELLKTILELRPDLQKQIEADMKREKLDPEKLEDHLVTTMPIILDKEYESNRIGSQKAAFQYSPWGILKSAVYRRLTEF